MTSTAPAPTQEPRPAPARGRIVVGVDGSACSGAALTWALQQARLTGSSVEALATWQPPAMIGMAGYGSYADLGAVDLSEPTTDTVREAVAAATRLGDPVEVTVTVLQGSASRELVRASDDADLLVVGSRGHGELSGVLLGSVGLYCVTHAACAVVVVPAPVAA
ncbi:MAG: uspA1 [Frankiales bacterium]|nr:uspA1 [Frankiales bacterium]